MKFNWLLGDHLGSTSMVADASGTMVSEIRYSAFGETRYENGSMTTDYLYTGQRQEVEIGLYYYVARWYDPGIGRFVQADSIVPNPASAEAFDRYAYTANNPTNYVDPSGHMYITEPGSGPCGYCDQNKIVMFTVLDWAELDNIASNKTGYSGTQTYIWYLHEWFKPYEDSWLWQKFGADGEFSLEEGLSVLVLYEWADSIGPRVEELTPELIAEALDRFIKDKINYFSEETSWEKYVNHFAWFIDSGQYRVPGLYADEKELFSEFHIKWAIDVSKLIMNPNWGGFLGGRPFGWGACNNKGNCLPEIKYAIENNIIGGKNSDKAFFWNGVSLIPSGCLYNAVQAGSKDIFKEHYCTNYFGEP